jgi:tellurite resistance protein
MISPHAALIYTMVMVSASDREMTDHELRKIGEQIRGLPVFAGFNAETLPRVAADCADILDQTDGLDRALALIEEALPPKLRETAYALACDVAAADGEVQHEEAELLQLLRHRLRIERLIAAAIERGARARYTRL